MRPSALIAVALVAAGPAVTEAPLAVVVVSPGPAAYRDAAAGAVESLERARLAGPIRTIDLDRGDARAEAAMAEARVIVAVGAAAASRARKGAPRVPLVYAMVLDPAAAGLPAPGAALRADVIGVTGVTMRAAEESQLDLLRELVPEASRIGVLYDPEVSTDSVRRASAAAKSRNLSLVAHAVRDESEVLAGASLLAPQVDAIWGIADPTVLTAANARALVLFCLRSRKPLLAISESFVRSGALAAVAADPRAVGLRAGTLAETILAGTRAAELEPEPPPRLSVFLNVATAGHLGIPVPREVAAKATVYPRP